MCRHSVVPGANEQLEPSAFFAAHLFGNESLEQYWPALQSLSSRHSPVPRQWLPRPKPVPVYSQIPPAHSLSLLQSAPNGLIDTHWLSTQ
jgi:hypothetical protein